MSAGEERFAFGTGLRLAVAGPRTCRRHFLREYGRARAAAGDAADLVVRFTAAGGEPTVSGGHKTVGWRVWLPAPDAAPLTAAIALTGRPRGFACSLVQGYFVEPLLAVAAARADTVLLPAAAVEQDGGALVLTGTSGMGKSTLAARTAARGTRVLGDDHVLLDAEGRCWPFPRRVRLYPDIAETAPAAYRRLGALHRGSLQVRRAVRRLTRGYVAPSLQVEADRLGGRHDDGPLPVRRVVLLSRDDGAGSLRTAPLGRGEVLAAAQHVLEDQRAHLLAAGGAWAEELERVRERERSVLERALAAAAAERVAVPERWEATEAVDALWRELALGPA